MVKRRTVLLGSGAALLATTGLGFGFGNMGSLKEYNEAMAKLRAPAQRSPDVLDLVRQAALAANSHNTQAWRFKIGRKAIEILPDFTRQTPAVDPDNHHLYASLGCAAANLDLAAQAAGLSGELSFDGKNDGSLVFTLGNTRIQESAMSLAITKRQSTRAEYDGKPVSPDDLQQLVKAASVPGVDLILITARPQIDKVRDLVLASNTKQIADSAFVRELKNWLRFNPRSALLAGNGLFSATSGNPSLPDWLGPIVFDWFFSAKAENEKYVRQINSSFGIAVFFAEKNDPEHWVLAGRACQRFALEATAQGLKHAFINQPVEVPEFRPELANLAGMPGRRPDIVMRFGYGPQLPYSPRLPLAKIMA